MSDATLQRQARQELERRLATERGRYYTPNGGIERFLIKLGREISVGDKRIHICILRGGNGIGKTCFASNLASYILNRHPNKYFDAIPFLKNFRKPTRGRILTTATAAETAYDEEMAKWMPAGRYRTTKGGHKFNQKYTMTTDGSVVDILTFKQDPAEGESATLDWAIVDEPMPYNHWKALKMRFRFGGVIFLILTALEGAEWYDETFETPERMAPGGDVHVMQLSAEENCIQHGVRGIVEHSTLESQWADLDENDMLARKDGGYFASAGVIYQTYRDQLYDLDPGGRVSGHLMKDLTGYYYNMFAAGKYTLYNIIDPAGRKPFAIGWYCSFPNGKTICVAEWPDDSMRLFHKIKSWPWDVESYARMIRATEKEQFGRPADIRIIDPNFGNSPSGTSNQTVIERFRAAGKLIEWPLEYDGTVDDDVTQGHIAARSLLGDPDKGINPDLFILEHCRNHRHGLKYYAYKENQDETKGLSQAPQYKLKDFPDLIRYLAMRGALYRKRVDLEDPEVIAAEKARKAKYRPRRLPNGYVGAG